VGLGVTSTIARYKPDIIPLVTALVASNARYSSKLGSVDALNISPLFDTAIDGLWGYNAALQFIVPGTCRHSLPFLVLGRLGVSRKENGSFEFQWDSTQRAFTLERPRPLHVGWTNQLNPPVYTSLNITGDGIGISQVPKGLHGTILAGIVTEELESARALASATLAGPVMIQVP
jgi:hypothetical protein